MNDTSQVGIWISPDWKIDTSYKAEVLVSPPPNISENYRMIEFDTVDMFTLSPNQDKVKEDIEDIYFGEITYERYLSIPQELIDYRDYKTKRGI